MIVLLVTNVKLSFSHSCSWLKGEPPGTRTLAAGSQKKVHVGKMLGCRFVVFLFGGGLFVLCFLQRKHFLSHALPGIGQHVFSAPPETPTSTWSHGKNQIPTCRQTKTTQTLEHNNTKVLQTMFFLLAHMSSCCCFAPWVEYWHVLNRPFSFVCMAWINFWLATWTWNCRGPYES